jgi:diguanylate cyclase (GGDEF)-like protein
VIVKSRHLLEEIEKEIERSRRHHHLLSALMVDVDNFKSVNDSYGHPSGDQILREVAQVLAVSIRKIDIVGRYGGDEFVVILPEAGRESARVVAERVLEGVRTHRFQTKSSLIQTTVSVGVVTFSDLNRLSTDDFIEKIDRVMFKAKSTGKNRVFFDEPSSE